MSKYFLLHGDALDCLQDLPAQSYDSMITDCPAGIAFMGKDWDKDKGGRAAWIKWITEIFKEAHRVLKPGSHAFVWALPRTSHWTATALEDAGFQVRDIVTHLFGSGFPKSWNISKAIDKKFGAKREVVDTYKISGNTPSRETYGSDDRSNGKGMGFKPGDIDKTAPSTPQAKQWDGWGTALKPSSEHWILVRKPLEKKHTIADNVLKHGVGGINIDASMVELHNGETTHGSGKSQSNDPNTAYGDMGNKRVGVPNIKSTQGRFPANTVLSHSVHCKDDQCDIECPVSVIDKQSGVLKSGARTGKNKNPQDKSAFPTTRLGAKCEASSGGASRFFYQAKPSKRERNAGCEINGHPCVKSKTLMSYLIKMITPPKGKVLDPFMGSGSTGVACVENGFQFLGIEQEKEYIEIARKRIEHYNKQ